MSFEDWEKLFQNSTAVHFASSQTSKLANIGKISINIFLIINFCCLDDPQYSAYAVLGPHYCPISYYSDINF